MTASGPYRLPSHARQYFGSAVNGQWGGVDWASSSREVHVFKGCPANGLQTWRGDGGKVRAVFYQSVCNIDSDGPSPTFKAAELLARDPDWQRETSLKWEKPWRDADGRMVYDCDSRGFLGIVLPPQFREKYGVQLGDFGLVCHNGNVRAGQWFDTGPRSKLGEFSQFLVGEIGLPNNPRTGNDATDVCTLMFPGSGLHLATGRADQQVTALELFHDFTRGAHEQQHANTRCNGLSRRTCAVQGSRLRDALAGKPGERGSIY
jgi:hypothetical protein